MKGGYQIIDITASDLEIKAEQTAISNSKILKQLDALKTYIEDGYDFSKPLNNQLKPILLRFRDKKANEKQEASVWANLSKKDDNLTFIIEAVVNSTNLSTIQIEVVFELKQDEAGNNYYGIKTAKYLLSGGVSGGIKLYRHSFNNGTLTFISNYGSPLYVRTIFGTLGITTQETDNTGNKDILVSNVTGRVEGTSTNCFYTFSSTVATITKADGTNVTSYVVTENTSSEVTEL